MNEEKNVQPGGNAPAGPDGNKPAVTPTPKSAPAAPVDPSNTTPPEGYELIRTEDKNKLISQRDKANNSGSEDSALVSYLMQKDAVTTAAASPDFKEKYPDVTVEELLEADPTNDAEITAIAEKRQARYEEIKQNHIKKVQVATAPSISPTDKSQKLKDLAKPAKASRFQAALQTLRMPTQ